MSNLKSSNIVWDILYVSLKCFALFHDVVKHTGASLIHQIFNFAK